MCLTLLLLKAPRRRLLCQPCLWLELISCILSRCLLSFFECEDFSSRWLLNESQIQRSLHQCFISLFGVIVNLHQQGGRDREKEKELKKKTFSGRINYFSLCLIQRVKIQTWTRNYSTKGVSQKSTLAAWTYTTLILRRNRMAWITSDSPFAFWWVLSTY